MSRTTDLRLSGWVKDSNLFDNDLRFVNLIENKGAISYLIYDIMRGLISSKYGYYAILDDSFILRIHRTLGRCSKGQAHIKETILYFGKIGILDKCLLKNNILTSADIQESWLIAKRAKRAKITDNLEHWLLVDTLPSINDNNCYNNENKCSKNKNKCCNNNDNCTLDKTRHDSKLNTNINEIDISEQDKYTADKVLDIVLNKDTTCRAMQAFKSHPNYEHYYKYAIYIADACNDTRLNKFGGDDYLVNNDLFMSWVHSIKWQELFEVFRECYDRHKDIHENVAYYLRGIIYNKYKKVYLKGKNRRFER